MYPARPLPRRFPRRQPLHSFRKSAVTGSRARSCPAHIKQLFFNKDRSIICISPGPPARPAARRTPGGALGAGQSGRGRPVVHAAPGPGRGRGAATMLRMARAAGCDTGLPRALPARADPRHGRAGATARAPAGPARRNACGRARRPHPAGRPPRWNPSAPSTPTPPSTKPPPRCWPPARPASWAPARPSASPSRCAMPTRCCAATAC